MKYIVKAVKWYFDGFWGYLGFIFGMTAFVALLQGLLVYPVQIITAVIIGFAAYAMFCFFID